MFILKSEEKSIYVWSMIKSGDQACEGIKIEIFDDTDELLAYAIMNEEEAKILIDELGRAIKK